jgi:hypothetical protein
VRTVLGTGGEMGRKAVDTCHEGAIIRKPYNLQYVVKRLHNALADMASSGSRAGTSGSIVKSGAERRYKFTSRGAKIKKRR